MSMECMCTCHKDEVVKKLDKDFAPSELLSCEHCKPQEKKVGKLTGVCNCECHCDIECRTDHDKTCDHCRKPQESMECKCGFADKRPAIHHEKDCYLHDPKTCVPCQLERDRKSQEKEGWEERFQKLFGHLTKIYTEREMAGSFSEYEYLSYFIEKELQVSYERGRQDAIQEAIDSFKRYFLKMYGHIVVKNGKAEVTSHDVNFFGNELLMDLEAMKRTRQTAK